MRFRTKNVAYSTGLSQVRAVSYWLPCGADGRTDRHLTITSLPKFLGSIGNHFFLSTVLRGRGFAARSSDITDENNVYMALFKKGKGTLLIFFSQDFSMYSRLAPECCTLNSFIATFSNFLYNCSKATHFENLDKV